MSPSQGTGAVLPGQIPPSGHKPLREGSPARPAAGARFGGFVWTLVRTDFKTRYYGTASGFMWALLKPTAMFIVLVSVFSLVFRSDPTYKLDLVIGLFLWDFFADATKTGMTSLANKGFLLNKAAIPKWILVVTSIANALITLAVFAGIVSVYIVTTRAGISWLAFLAFAGYLVAFALIAIGFSLGSSVLYLRYRDLNQVWDMTIQAGFFVSPIIYPIGVIPERFHFWLYLWPPTVIIEFSRAALVDGVIPTARAHLFLALMVTGVMTIGTLIFRRHAPRAPEYV